MKTIDLSVVIINWNTKELLLNCIRSIQETTHKISYEIIVVDNGSQDGSQRAVNENFSEVRLIENGKNLGFARANNIGIRASCGRYVCLVNSDVVLLEGCLDTMLAYMESQPSIGILGPKLLNGDMSLQPSCKQLPSIWNNLCIAIGLSALFANIKLFNGEHLSFFDHDRIMNVQALSGAFLMVRRSAAEKVGLLDEAFFIYGEEIDWCMRFTKSQYKIVFFSGARAIHFGSGSSSKEPVRFYRELYSSKLRFYKKHFKHHYWKIMILVHLLRQNLRILKYLIYGRLRATHNIDYSKELRMHREVIHLLWAGLS
jgi:GT2 family glycosyltransferase